MKEFFTPHREVYIVIVGVQYETTSQSETTTDFLLCVFQTDPFEKLS